MALSRIRSLLKKSRPPSRSARRPGLTLQALEDRVVLSFAPAAAFPVGVLPRAVTVADFNKDGTPDLAVFNAGSSTPPQGSLSVLLGDGDGSFGPAVNTDILNNGGGQGDAESMAVGDFNGDGLPDVALNTTGPAGPAVEVLLGNGDGSFRSNHLTLGVGQVPVSVAAGDFDGNGALDLVTADISSGSLSLLMNNGDGTFRPAVNLTVGGAPRAVAVGDFNGDGKLDVATAEQLADSVSVLLGHGDGTFARPLVFAAGDANLTPDTMAVADVNGDGKLDLAIKSISSLDSDAFQVGVLLGHGDGTFQAPLLGAAQPDASGEMALGDFNHDGLMDVAVADRLGDPSGDLSVFAGNGDGTFQSLIRLDLPTGGDGPLGVAAADLNGDGLADLVAANAGSGTVGVLLNDVPPTTAAATTTTLDTSAATSIFGQRILLTASVRAKPGPSTGTVSFFDGPAFVGTAQIDDAGQATLRVSLGAGTHSLTASFAGDSDFAGSTSAAVTETVDPDVTRMGLVSSANPAAAGQAVTFTATVGAAPPGSGTPTGTVTFRDGDTVLGTVALGADGTAAFTTSFATAGSHAVTAVYSGDANFTESSQSLAEQVNAPAPPQATTTALSSSADPATVGRVVTFTASVRGPAGVAPTGTITFFVGRTAVARFRLDGHGQARLTGSFSRRGLYTIRAVYSGDANFSASSQSLVERVNR